MSHCVIIRSLIGDLRIRVDERRVSIAEDVGVGLILHHDQEHVIELAEFALQLGFVGLSGVRRDASQNARRSQSKDDTLH